jgi:hypothetical protein
MDKLLVLRAGRAEAFGPPGEILRRLNRVTNGTAQVVEARPRNGNGNGSAPDASVQGNGSEPATLSHGNGPEPTAPQPHKRRPDAPKELGDAS